MECGFARPASFAFLAPIVISHSFFYSPEEQGFSGVRGLIEEKRFWRVYAGKHAIAGAEGSNWKQQKVDLPERQIQFKHERAQDRVSVSTRRWMMEEETMEKVKVVRR